MNTAIVANGAIDDVGVIQQLLQNHARIIAVDGGLAHCDQMGIIPQLIVGDFDSCPKNILEKYKNVPTIILPKDKDETDLEFAIKREIKDANVTLYAAWGHRIDHSLTNALLLMRFPGRLRMETEKEIVFAIDQKITIPCFIGQTLSLIPIGGPVAGIVTHGLKWELHDGTLDQNFIGISNVCLKSHVEISVKKGSLICCLIKAAVQ